MATAEAPIESREYSPEEQRLLYLWRTEEKVAKIRLLLFREDISGNKIPYVIESPRPCVTVDVAKREGEFCLVSQEKAVAEGRDPGKPSGAYLNLRIPSDEMAMLMGKILADRLPEELRGVSYCAGIHTTGRIIAQEFSRFSGIPCLDLYQKANLPDGTTTIIPKPDAPRGNGEYVLTVDDVLTKGTTFFPTVRATESLGYQVLGLAGMVNRQQDGDRRILAEGFKLHFAYTARELYDRYLLQTDATQITPEEHRLAIASL